MNAVISGRAAVALAIDGQQLYSIHYDAIDDCVERDLGEWSLLLGGVDDIEFVEDCDEDAVRDRLEDAVDRTEALDLVLYLLDGSLSDEVRRTASLELDELLAYPEIVTYLESILYAKPLPESADPDGARRCCDAAAEDALNLLETLVQHQKAIGVVQCAFEAACSEILVDDQLCEVESAFLQSGAFAHFAKAGDCPYAIGQVSMDGMQEQELSMRLGNEVLQTTLSGWADSIEELWKSTICQENAIPLSTIDLAPVARDLKLALDQVQRTAELLDDGNTVPFITRYRKEKTGGLGEEQIRLIHEQAKQLRGLAERRATILKSIESQGKLTAELAGQIKAAPRANRLEDLYLQFRQDKQTLETLARLHRLEPFVNEILEGCAESDDLAERATHFVDIDHQLNNVDEVIQGVKYLFAEGFSEMPDLRRMMRKLLWRKGRIVSTRASEGTPTSASQEVPTVDHPAAIRKRANKQQDNRLDKLERAFRDYYDFSEAVFCIPPHRVLAINRGERARILRVKLELDSELVEQEAAELVLPLEHPHAEFLKQCLTDALSRLVLPSLKREIRRELTEKAESHAVAVFAKNLRSLLLQPPVHGCRPLAVDPGFRDGCKFSALDGSGNVLANGVAHIVGKPERIQEGRKQIAETIKEHNLNVIAIGNGTACRETEQLVAEMLVDELKDLDVSYVVVNAAGASVYSTSPLGREELAEYDAVLRGAISIGRRLLDPLSELVKINPADIGVGMYQHYVKAKHLEESLYGVVESCVNFVGVDVNTASPALLRYVSGLNQSTARRLFGHRQQHGPFKNREQLKEVAGFGEATFVQSAGFLKINGGDNPLDATWIHPESYEVTRKLLDKLGSNVEDLATHTPSASEESPTETEASQTPELADQSAETQTGFAQAEAQRLIAERVSQLDVAATASELGIGGMLLSEILNDLQHPGRDPREDLPKPIFRRGILKLEELTQGMELTGTVVNVADFGAFVDIGLYDTGLVHISRLANRFIKDPHEVVCIGDDLTVWVHEIDKERRRVSLTAIKPGTEKAPDERDSRPDRQQRKSRPPGRRDRAAVKKKQPAASRRDSRRAKLGKQSRSFEKKRKPKPITPITDTMAEGHEPLRSFSDLVHFIEKKVKTDDDESKSDEEQDN